MSEVEPFGRQPKPVKVTLEGEAIDVAYWLLRLKRTAEFKGDLATQHDSNSLTIYPRAVND